MRNRWRLGQTYQLIHSLQPAALIGNNHHQPPFPGEDFQMFERDLPGENSMGFNSTTVSSLPLEMAETMNGSWGFNLIDDQFKSTRTLVRSLVAAAGRSGCGNMARASTAREAARLLPDPGASLPTAAIASTSTFSIGPTPSCSYLSGTLSVARNYCGTGARLRSESALAALS
jgi:hypothetical protein